MDNQHRKIAGYRELDEGEVASMNLLKDLEERVKEALAEVNVSDASSARWAAIARTHLETGFMFALKAVARPTNGLGRV
jgi:hypothetical protein